MDTDATLRRDQPNGRRPPRLAGPATRLALAALFMLAADGGANALSRNVDPPDAGSTAAGEAGTPDVVERADTAPHAGRTDAAGGHRDGEASGAAQTPHSGKAASDDLGSALPETFNSRDDAKREDDRPPAPMKGPFISLRDGRGVMEPAPDLHLKRLPPGPVDHPVTRSVTTFGDWSVACESRHVDQACSAAAYFTSSGLRLKVKFGLAADPSSEASDADDPPPSQGDRPGVSIARVDDAPATDDGGEDAKAATPGPADAKGGGRTAAGAKRAPAKATPKQAAPQKPKTRYVVEIEGPPGLDADTGFGIVAQRAVGFLPLDKGCDRSACRVVSEVSADLAPILAPDAHDAGGFAVIATSNGTAMMWRFSTNGLKEAFDKVKADGGEAARAAEAERRKQAERNAEIARLEAARSAAQQAKAAADAARARGGARTAAQGAKDGGRAEIALTRLHGAARHGRTIAASAARTRRASHADVAQGAPGRFVPGER